MTTGSGLLVFTAVGAGITGSAGGGEVAGTTVVTGAVPDDWVQPAMNIHAITSRKRKIPGHLIHNFFLRRQHQAFVCGSVSAYGRTAGGSVRWQVLIPGRTREHHGARRTEQAASLRHGQMSLSRPALLLF